MKKKDILWELDDIKECYWKQKKEGADHYANAILRRNCFLSILNSLIIMKLDG